MAGLNGTGEAGFSGGSTSRGPLTRRVCSSCHKEKPIAEFQSRVKARKGRLTRSCLTCRDTSYDRVARASALLTAWRRMYLTATDEGSHRHDGDQGSTPVGVTPEAA
jgi:hypothetical protein